MEYLLIVIMLIGLIILWFSKSNKISYQSTKEKKEQIIAQYIAQMEDQLSTTNDPEQQKQIKTTMLKQANSELSRNIFFDPHEIKEVMLRLSKI